MTNQSEQDKLELIKKSGILDIRGGSAIINFDAYGRIRKVEMQKVLFAESVGFTSNTQLPT